MAKMKISNPMSSDGDSGYPIGRQVDGTNVEECASHEGAFRNFGKTRRGMRIYTNSKTGARTEMPEYADDNDDVPHGSGFGF